MSVYIYVRADGTPKGPISLDELRTICCTGQLTLNDRVRDVRTNEWIILKTLCERGLLDQSDFPTPTTSGSPPVEYNPSGAERSCLVDRYRDGYRVARAVITVGTLIKVIAWLLAIAIWIAGFVASGQSPREARGTLVFMSLATGSVELVLTFGLGVLVSAVGQILLSSLDTAVNTSPFLEDAEKLQAFR